MTRFISQRINILLLTIVAVWVLLGCTSEKKAVPDSIQEIARDFIFGDDRPFAQCHASTVIQTEDKNFLVAWFGGKQEKDDDVGIWLSRGSAKNWSAPNEVAKIRHDPHWNPVLFKAPSGEIILYFKVGKTIDQWETWSMKSTDDGLTWTTPTELITGDRGGRGPVRNHPIVLSDGSWLAPASNEANRIWNAFVDRSSDQGKTWLALPFLSLNRDSIPNEGVIQPTVWQSSPKEVHMFLRSSSGFICRADSRDNGVTWSSVYKTSLPNPNSGIDVARLDDGGLALAYNPNGKNWGERRPLTVSLSRDNGKTWPASLEIETGKKGDEFSYPSIIGFGDTVVVTYTWKRQRIGFWMGKIGH